MKQILLVLLLALPCLVMAQPPQFEPPCSNGNNRQLIRFVEIDGMDAVPGEDWAAVIDDDGWTVARRTIILLEDFDNGNGTMNNCPDAPAYALDVEGTNSFGLGCPAQNASGTDGYGLANGENFQVVVWDASTGIFYTVPEVLTWFDSFAPFGAPAGGRCDTLNADGQSSLPVTYAYINARSEDGKSVRIKWGTASESGSDVFEVQHSRNFRNFETIATVGAAGESSQLREYAVSDLNPLVGENYYRIKQTDFDGTVSYSGIVLVDLEPRTTVPTLTLYPNPATNYVNVDLGGKWIADVAQISVFSAVGRKVQSYVQPTDAVAQLQVGDLPAGIYLVRVDAGKQRVTRRLVIR